MPDGTSRFSLGGKPLLHYMGTSTFANFTVLPEIAVAKIREDAPFDKVCYIGCGVTTGIGAVLNTAKVEPGAKVVVFGLGGIGLNVIQGAGSRGPTNRRGRHQPRRDSWRPLRHDPLREPEGGRRRSRPLPRQPHRAGGADYTFECVGDVTLMRQALECLPQGLGRVRHHRRGRRRPGDRHPALPARHRPGLEGHRLRRRARPHRRAPDCRLVHGEEDRNRSPDHPHHAARRDQRRLQPDAQGKIIRSVVLY